MLSRKIKTVLFILFYTMLVLGVVLASVTTLATIGYWLYLWGAQALPIGVAAWSAFVFGIKYALYCISSIIIGALGMTYFE